MKEKILKTKKVTIDGSADRPWDDLAVMMSKGFSDVNKKFATVYKMIAEGREETNDLAIMVARGFERVGNEIVEVKKDITEVKRDLTEVKDNLVSTRGDVLAMGDRFTLKYEFYDLSTRVGILEQSQKVKAKK